jgi:hypothetical protein
MKSCILACILACCMATGLAQDASLPAHTAVDICTRGNTRILLINTLDLHSFALNDNSLDTVLNNGGGTNLPGCFFIQPYDGESALYVSSLRGKTSITHSTIGSYGYNDYPIKLDYSFNPYAAVALPGNQFAIFGLEEKNKPYDMLNGTTGKTMHMVWSNDQGEVQRQVSFSGIQPANIHSAQADAAGNFCLLVSVPSEPSGTYNYHLLKLNPQGTVIWDVALNTRNSGIGGSMYVNPDNEIFIYISQLVVVGESYNQELQSDMILLKFTAGGEIVWQKTYTPPGFDEPIALLHSPDGFLIGVSKNFREGILTEFNNLQVYVFDLNGTELRQFNEHDSEYAIDPLAAVINENNDLIVVGEQDTHATRKKSAYVKWFSRKKLKGEQTFLWE